MLHRRIATALATLPLLMAAANLHAQQVLLSPEQAIREIFPDAARTVRDVRRLPPEVKHSLTRALGRSIADDSLVATLVYDDRGQLRGYAVVGEEIGKYEPITFMVGVTPAFTVRDVAVLVYRETRGGDVKRKRFLSQYRGKTDRDPIATDRDIVNISGATLSVRAMNAGVKRVLAEVTAVYRQAEK